MCDPLSPPLNASIYTNQISQNRVLTHVNDPRTKANKLFQKGAAYSCTVCRAINLIIICLL